MLHGEPNGDLDIRFSLFTKKFGKLTAKAKSARKITSKLRGHLQPGNLVKSRIVEKNGLHVADALKEKQTGLNFADLKVLKDLLIDGEPDLALWSMLTSGQFTWARALRNLGWDPAHAKCDECGSKPIAFNIERQLFFCVKCASALGQKALIYI